MRRAPSFTNPSMFRCVPGSTFYSPHHCHPGDLMGTVPVRARLGFVDRGRRGGHGAGDAVDSLLGAAPAFFGAFTPGVAKTFGYTASIETATCHLRSAW